MTDTAFKPTLKKVHLQYITNFFNECKADFPIPTCLGDSITDLQKADGFKAMKDNDAFPDDVTIKFRSSMVKAFLELYHSGNKLFCHDAFKVLIEVSEEISFEDSFQNDFIGELRDDKA